MILALASLYLFGASFFFWVCSKIIGRFFAIQMLPITLHTAAAKPTEEKRGRGAQHRYWLFFNFPYMCSGSHENKIREDFVLKRSHFHRSWLCLVVIYLFADRNHKPTKNER
jgi:hypothetical protein